jgi:hypothetical protein
MQVHAIVDTMESSLAVYSALMTFNWLAEGATVLRRRGAVTSIGQLIYRIACNASETRTSHDVSDVRERVVVVKGPETDFELSCASER